MSQLEITRTVSIACWPLAYSVRPLTCSVIASINEKINRCRNTLFVSHPDSDREALVSKKGESANGTCEWILQDPKYQSWLAGEFSALRVSGGPGTGKTVLSLFLTEQLQAHCKDTGEHLLFFFCQFQDDRYNDARVVLRSLAYQLLDFSHDGLQIDEILGYFKSEEKTKDVLSDFEGLWKILETLLSQPGLPTIWCIIDGIDECSSFETLEGKLYEYCRRREHCGVRTKLKLLILGRRHPWSSATNAINLDNGENESVTRAVEVFVNFELAQLETISGFGQIRPVITRLLIERSQGRFLWASIVISELSKKQTCSEMMDTIELFPTDLYAALDRILHGTDSRCPRDSASALNSLAFAEGPLTLNELAAATTRRHSEADIEAVADVVQAWRPFVEVHKGKVSFVHDSVKEHMKRGLAVQWLVDLSGRPAKRRRIGASRP
jgi:hypothetical protein